MSKRSDLKENILAAKAEKGLSWILDNKVPVLAGLGIAIFAILVSSVFVLRRNEKRELTWARLAQAQALLGQRQLPQAGQVLTEIKSEAPDLNTSLYASYYIGQLKLAENKFEEASQSFSDVVEKSGNPKITPLALSNLGYSYERLSDYSRAAQTYQRFMDQYNDHFMAPRIQLAMGRSMMRSGDGENGKAALDQLIDLYPTSPWAENARRILDKSESR